MLDVHRWLYQLLQFRAFWGMYYQRTPPPFFYRWENWGSEQLSNLPKVSLPKNRAGSRAQGCLSPVSFKSVATMPLNPGQVRGQCFLLIVLACVVEMWSAILKYNQITSVVLLQCSTFRSMYWSKACSPHYTFLAHQNNVLRGGGELVEVIHYVTYTSFLKSRCGFKKIF